jgi:hypothetical protein
MNNSELVGVRSLDPVAEFDTSWRIAGIADVNRDGRHDIIWQNNNDGTLAAWFMNGLSRVQVLPIAGGSVTGPNWKIVGPK